MKSISHFFTTAVAPVVILFLSVPLFYSCTSSPEEEKPSTQEPWIEYASAEAAGFDADSLKKIDQLIKRMTEERKIPGAAALVAKEGKIVYQTSYGFQDVEAKTSMDTTDIFRIASMTKPITTVAIMQLYEAGKLQLSDPVSAYIPSFKDPKVLTKFNAADTSWQSRDASREITIHDLLTHTAGISYGFTNPEFRAIYAKNQIPDLTVPSEKTIAEGADALGKMPLAHDPGEKFTYGLNTDVLGRIVEVASGKELEEYVQENITGPLQMEDTRFFYEEDISDRLATVYTINPEDSAIAEMKAVGMYDPEYPHKGAKRYYSGGSGMSSTLQDYFIFSQTLLNGGEYKGVRILQDSTVALMTSNQLGENRWSETETFGYGLMIRQEKEEGGKPGEVVYLGWSGAFNTWFYINPKEEVVGVIMSQVLGNPYGDELTNGFFNAIEQALQEEEVMANLE